MLSRNSADRSKQKFFNLEKLNWLVAIIICKGKFILLKWIGEIITELDLPGFDIDFGSKIFIDNKFMNFKTLSLLEQDKYPLTDEAWKKIYGTNSKVPKNNSFRMKTFGVISFQNLQKFYRTICKVGYHFEVIIGCIPEYDPSKIQKALPDDQKFVINSTNFHLEDYCTQFETCLECSMTKNCRWWINRSKRDLDMKKDYSCLRLSDEKLPNITFLTTNAQINPNGNRDVSNWLDPKLQNSYSINIIDF